MHPHRSVLFMPATNERALNKARTLAADVIAIDLEDAVAPEAKASARDQLRDTVLKGGFGHRKVVARVNPLDTDYGSDDIKAVARLPLDAVLLPKVEHEDEIQAADAALEAAGAKTDLALWFMIETPRGVLAAERLCAASPRLQCVALGTSDLAKDLRVPQSPSRTGLMHALSTCVLAARAHGLDVLDGVYLNFRDADGYRKVCEQGRALGFDGKTLIHPSQIADANEIFAPAVEQVDTARRLLEAWKAARANGEGVAVLDGKLVENLHVEEAERILALHENIIAAQDSQAD